MQSTYLCIILAGFYFTTINPKTLIKKLSFDGCKNDSWRVTDISLMPHQEVITIVADIAYGNKPTNVIHQVRLNLTGCGENFKCTNHTDIVVGDLKCGTNVTELDKEACDVAKTLAEWQLENKESIGNGTITNLEDRCIHFDTKFVDQELIDKITTNKTEEIFAQVASQWTDRVAKLNVTNFS